MVLSTTFDPVTYAALGFLAARENPAKGHATRLIGRLVREELDRSHPGAWDELGHQARLPDNARLEPRELSAVLAAELGRVLRGRVEK